MAIVKAIVRKITSSLTRGIAGLEDSGPKLVLEDSTGNLLLESTGALLLEIG